VASAAFEDIESGKAATLAGTLEISLKPPDRVAVLPIASDLPAADLGPDGYQPSRCHKLPPSGHGIVSLGHTQVSATKWQDTRSALPGLAWAAKRAILEEHGLYDAMIIGSGDTSIFHAMYGHFEHELERRHLSGAHEDHFLSWARPYYQNVARRVGTVVGRVYHLWHGEFVNRNYRGRHRLLADFDFDPSLDLMIGENGAWQWARPRPDLEVFLERYFFSRAEDG